MGQADARDLAPGEAEDTFADDIALDLACAGGDREATRREHPIEPPAAIRGIRGFVLELAVRAEQLHREFLDAHVKLAVGDLLN